MKLEQLCSAIYNNVVSGLSGVDINSRFTLEQIEDSVINERQSIIKEYSLKNLIPKRELMLSINCLTVDCESIDRCCTNSQDAELIKHIEIPQIISDFGIESVDFIGSTDRSFQFVYYIDSGWRNHKFKRRGSEKPYVWIDTTPNKNNKYDAFIFNAPFVKNVSIVAIFKDPRQLSGYSCCNAEEINNISFIDKDIEKRVTENYIRYYRQMASANLPNNQIVT